MKARSPIRNHRSETGIALLIAIFVLLLISVVGIALIVSSGTESALAGNYRSATGVYYAALAGLEEARGRLTANNPSSFQNTAPGLIPPPGTNPVYIINPAPGETVAPWVPGSAYADTEYQTEFNPANPPNNSPRTNSVSTVAGVQGPLYKWVRINAVTELSLKLDTDGDGLDPATIYYDGTRLTVNPAGAQQVLEITSLAVLPNGSQKLLQYLVAPKPVNLPNFPGALIIAGNSANGVTFTPPTSNTSYYASGVDLTGVPGCTPGPAVHAIGVFDDNDVTQAISGIPSGMQPKYNGLGSAPDVVNVMSSGLFLANLQTPSQLDALSQAIIQSADVIITPTAGSSANRSDLTPLGMTSSNPLTVVVNGDLDLKNCNCSGYGLLLVTGNLNYDPDSSWNGIVLVIGQGTVTGSHRGSGAFNGAFLVAKTRDSSGNLLPDPNLGKASVIFDDDMGGQGFKYSSCWIQRSRPNAAKYTILSFHEIAQ